MKPLVTAARMAAIDRRTSEEGRVPSLILMENAGLKTYLTLKEKAGSVEGLRVVLVCGKGNNGGDGFVVGRHLLNDGAGVVAYLMGEVPDVSGDAKTNLEAFRGLGGRLVEGAGSKAKLEELRSDLMEADIVIDALLGTGLDSEVHGAYSAAIDAINDSLGFVVAIDIPSGVHADTGQILGNAVMADLTCTYGAVKIGQFQYPGRELCGELVQLDISIPPHFIEEGAGDTFVVDETDLWPGLFDREPDAHKGHYGHLLVIAGSHGKSGASVLVCRGAHRIGAGLVTLAIAEGLESVAAPQTPETMTVLLPENEKRGLAEGTAKTLVDLAAERSAVAIGPGIPADPVTDKVLEEFLRKNRTPIVIDADGLNLLARLELSPGELGAEAVIVTPHPGEMSRLTGKSTGEIQSDRLEIARTYAEEEGVICVLKGAGTVIATPDGGAVISPFGNPALSSGGTGDVLTGMIGGLLAQEGVSPIDAAISAVIIHGLAADMLVAGRGVAVGVLAGDVAEAIPEVLGAILESLVGGGHDDEHDPSHDHEH